MKKLQKGFTLIELLVVVAIIGILATVVLASLGQARSRAKDAAAKAALSQLRAEMELNASSNGANGYRNGSSGNVCLGNVANGATKKFIDAASTNTGHTANCHADVNKYAAWVQLSGTGGEYFCVDSGGFAGKPATTPTGTSLNC